MMPEGRWLPGTMIYCRACDLDRHLCPGCGSNVAHGTIACAECAADSPLTRASTIPAQRDGFDSVVLLDHETAQEFVRYLNTYPLSSLRFAIDDGGIKVKVNGGSWSPPIGKMEK